MRESRYEISNFVCPECGTEFPIPRQKAKRRPEGHIKDLWCPHCKKTQKMIEIRPRDFVKNMSGEIIKQGV